MNQDELFNPVELNREVKALCDKFYPFHCNGCDLVIVCFENHGKDDYNETMNAVYKDYLSKAKD